MIEICEDKKNSIGNHIVMNLSEDGVLRGSAIIRIEGEWAYLEDALLEDSYDFFPIYDGLIRASINKALHRGALYFAIPLAKEKYQYLTKNRFLHYSDNEEIRYVDIEEFFSRGCSGGK